MNSWDVTLAVGPDERYGNLSDALDHISEESYRVLILVSRDLLQDIDSYIPTDRNIQYLKIASSDNSTKTIDFLGCNFFSNGITLEIDSTITMKDCFIFGGSQEDQGKPVVTPSSKIIINGKVDYVYGGGYAIGPGSVSTVLDSTVVINGQVSHLYGGGYAVQSGAVHSGRIHIQINENGSVDRIVNGGNCLIGPDCHSIIREIDLNITGKVTGNISLGGYAAYNSSTSVHDEIHLTAEGAELSGVIYDGIKLDDKSAITIAKVTGSISSEQQELLKFSEHNIQIIQSEPVSEPIGTQNDQYENEKADSNQSPNTEEKSDSADSIIFDASAGEQTEDDKTQVTPGEVSSGDDHLQPVPYSNMDEETPNSSDNDESGDSPVQPIVDTSAEEGNHNNDINETPDTIPSDEQLSATDPTQSGLSEISESPIDEGIDTSPDQTLPDNTPTEDNPGETTEIIPNSIPPVDSHPHGDREIAKSHQEDNNDDYYQPEENHFDGNNNDKHQAGYDNSPQEEKTGINRLLPIIGVLFILIALLVICFLFSRQKTNDQSTSTENESEEVIMNTNTPTLIFTVQSTSEEKKHTSLKDSITTTVLPVSTEENDNSDSAILTFLLTPTETKKPKMIFTPSVIIATFTSNPASSNISVTPSSTLKPTSTRAVDAPTATEEIIIPTETSSATSVATDTPIIPLATPQPTYTNVVPSETLTATEVTTAPTATATITLTIVSSETLTSQQYESPVELFQNSDTILIQEEKHRLASIQVTVDTGTYFYQRPYKSQEYVLRWLNNGTEVEILNGPEIRNNSEWYEIFCEEYDLSGWIISNTVKVSEN